MTQWRPLRALSHSSDGVLLAEPGEFAKRSLLEDRFETAWLDNETTARCWSKLQYDEVIGSVVDAVPALPLLKFERHQVHEWHASWLVYYKSSLKRRGDLYFNSYVQKSLSKLYISKCRAHCIG